MNDTERMLYYQQYANEMQRQQTQSQQTTPQTPQATSTLYSDSRASSLSEQERDAYREYEGRISDEESRYVAENVSGKRAVYVTTPSGAKALTYESLGVAGLTEPEKKGIASWKQEQRNVFFEEFIPDVRKQASTPQPLTPEEQQMMLGYRLQSFPRFTVTTMPKETLEFRSVILPESFREPFSSVRPKTIQPSVTKTVSFPSTYWDNKLNRPAFPSEIAKMQIGSETPWATNVSRYVMPEGWEWEQLPAQKFSPPTTPDNKIIKIGAVRYDFSKAERPSEFPLRWDQKVVQFMNKEMGTGGITPILRQGRNILFPETKLGSTLSAIEEYKRDTNFVTKGTVRPTEKTAKAAIDMPIGFVKGAESIINPRVKSFSGALVSSGVSFVTGKGEGGYIQNYFTDIKGREGELIGELLFEYASGKVLAKGIDKAWTGAKQLPSKIKSIPSAISNSRIAENVGPYINRMSSLVKQSETYQVLDDFIFAPSKQIYTYGKVVVYPQLKATVSDYLYTPAKNIFDYQFYYPVKRGLNKYVYQPTIKGVETLRLYGGIVKEEVGKRTVGAIKTKVSNVTGLYGRYVQPYSELVIKPYMSGKVDFAKAVFDDLVGSKIKLASQFYNVQIVGRTKAYAQLVIKPKFASIASSLSDNVVSPLVSVKPYLTKYTGIDKLTNLYSEIKYGFKLKAWTINIKPPVEYGKYTGLQLTSASDDFIYKSLMTTTKTPAQHTASTALGYSTKRTLEDIFKESVELPNLRNFVIKPLTETAKKGSGTIIRSGNQALILETKQITKQLTKQSTKSLLTGIVATQTLKQLQKATPKTELKALQKQAFNLEYKQPQVVSSKLVTKRIQKVNQLLKQEMVLSPSQVQRQEQKQKSFQIFRPVSIQKIQNVQLTTQKITPIQIQKQKLAPIQLVSQPQIFKIAQPQMLSQPQPQVQRQRQPALLSYRTLQRMDFPEEQTQITELKPEENIFTSKLYKQKMKYPIKAPETLMGFKKFKARSPFKKRKTRRKVVRRKRTK